jgi:hypothetical protein
MARIYIEYIEYILKHILECVSNTMRLNTMFKYYAFWCVMDLGRVNRKRIVSEHLVGENIHGYPMSGRRIVGLGVTGVLWSDGGVLA